MKKILVFVLVTMFSVFPALASQHDYNIANAPGSVVRADINSALNAIATNNSGATEPTTTFANMWWMDTSTNILKQRDNANTAWINVASKSGTTWIPYRSGSLIGTGSLLTTDTDTALAANSDSNVPTQKAVKAYADTKISKTTAGEIAAMTEKTALVDDDLLLIEDSEASNAKKKIKISSISAGTIDVFTSSGIWVAPAGVNYVEVTVCGGGGGGASENLPSGAGAGGGAGACILKHVMKVTPGNSYTVTVGAGGVGGDNSGDPGDNGGNSTFVGDTAPSNYTLTATGGVGGNLATGGTAATANLDASGGTGGGLFAISGGSGANASGGTGGGGGSSLLGKGGNQGAPGGNGGIGAGGGGGTTSSGGNGGDGIVIISYGNEN